MRIKRGFKARRRRKKVLKLAKGFRGGRSKLFRTAADAVDKSLMYAYRDRRQRKRDFRRLWIARINAAARMNKLSYSKFMHGLKMANIDLDRKVLADLAITDPAGFAKIAEGEGFNNIAVVFNSIAVAEKQHEKRYLDLAANIDAGRVFKRDATVVWRCRNCGYLHEGEEALAVCPACDHPQAHFELLGENW